jgi:hypothetical protein
MRRWLAFCAGFVAAPVLAMLSASLTGALCFVKVHGLCLFSV